MSGAEPVESELNNRHRFRLRPLHVFFVLSVCLMVIIYWWNGRPRDTDLCSVGNWNVVVAKSNAYNELKSRIEKRLNKEGFTKHRMWRRNKPSLFSGTWQGSSRIELQLDEWSAYEGDLGMGFSYSASYRLKLPDSSPAFQDEMKQLMRDFDGQVKSWFYECLDEMLLEKPELRDGVFNLSKNITLNGND